MLCRTATRLSSTPTAQTFIKYNSSKPNAAVADGCHHRSAQNSHLQEPKPESKKPPSSSTKTKRARNMAGLINTRPWSSELESSLATLAPQSSLSQTTVLHTLRLIKTPPKALHFFYWAHHYGFTHTSQSYLLTLQILCAGRNFHSARNFLFSIPAKSNGAVKLEDKHFNALIRAFGEAGIFKESIKLFETMKSIGVPPSVITYNHLFMMLLNRGRTRTVYQLFDEMRKTYGATPDVCTFNILIRGFCKNSMVDDAFRFFKEMEKFNLQPDVITYNTIVDGLCRDGRVKIAHNVVRGMAKKGSSLSPNVVTYTTLIRGYCGKKEVHEALAVLDEMILRGQKPNAITYNTLIQGLCEARMLDKVKEVLDGGFVPDVCTFNTLMNAHCNGGNLDGAMEIFKKMGDLKVQPDSVTYSMLIRGFSEKGEFEQAERLLQELSDKEILLNEDSCAPLVASYNPVFVYLCENGKTQMADKVFRQLLRRGKQDPSAFKTLIMGHCREGSCKTGFDLLVVMFRRDFVPDVETFEALISGLLQKDEPVLAHEALGMMLKSSHLPRAYIFHRILAELVKHGHAGESYSLINSMLEKKIRQNAKTATDTVRLLFGGGLKDKALDVVRCLYENGYLVNIEELITFLCQKKKLLVAQELLVFATKNGQRIDPTVYDTIIIRLCKIQRSVQAFELFYELLEQGTQQQPLTCLEDLRFALEAEGKHKEAEFVSKRAMKRSTDSSTAIP